MKRLFLFLVSVAFLGALAGCPAPLQTSASTSPAQQALNATAVTCKSNDAAIVAADQAVVLGVLKGNDARNALKGLTAVQAGCVTALAALQTATAAAAASGVSK